MITFIWLFVISLALHGVITSAHSHTLTSRTLGHCHASRKREMSQHLARDLKDLIMGERQARGIDIDSRSP